MKKLHFLFKLVLALLLFAFMIWYQNGWYNIILAAVLGGILYKEDIRIFRFPRQGYFFAFILLMMFVFQAIGGYGKIWLHLPFGVTITDTGVFAGFLFITQVLFIFLLFGAAVYSTHPSEIWHYYRQLSQQNQGWRARLQSYLRIGLYVMYLLPKTLDYRKKFSGKIQEGMQSAAPGLRAKLQTILDYIYRFMSDILSRSAQEFQQFKENATRLQPVQLPGIFNLRHVAVLIILAATHLPLILNS